MALKDTTIGILGLGQMGGGIAVNLATAGYSITGYDLKQEAIDRLVAAGGKAAASAEDVAANCEIVLTCLEGKDSIALADDMLLPLARTGQTFIDHSTVPAPETRRIGAAFLAKGCRYLDAPISGGRGGAEAGTLRIFVGGDKATADEMWPLFEAAGNPDKVVYCGEIGKGQDAKVVQQLTARLPDLARLEVMAFGLNAGLDLDTLTRALDVTPGEGNPYEPFLDAVRRGEDIESMGGLFSEWEYFLAEAKDKGFRMPILEALYEFVKDADRTLPDPLGRMMPSVWREMRG